MRRNLIFRHIVCVPLDKSNDGYGGRDCDEMFGQSLDIVFMDPQLYMQDIDLRKDD